MGTLVKFIFVVFICVFVYNTSLAASRHVSQYNYPPGSLACKLHDQNKLDCSNRGLIDIPKILDQNLTTTLDLSRNQISNITSSPFISLKILHQLYLQYNTISSLSSSSFYGLHTLECLDLEENMLSSLPMGIFQDLVRLTFLNLDHNLIASFPIQELVQLKSLQQVSFFKEICIFTPEIGTDGLQNLRNLHNVAFLLCLVANITDDTFDNLANLPLTSMEFLWVWPEHSSYIIQGNVFAPLTKITRMHTRFEVIPVLESLFCPFSRLTSQLLPGIEIRN